MLGPSRPPVLSITSKTARVRLSTSGDFDGFVPFRSVAMEQRRGHRRAVSAPWT